MSRNVQLYKWLKKRMTLFILTNKKCEYLKWTKPGTCVWRTYHSEFLSSLFAVVECGDSVSNHCDRV